MNAIRTPDQRLRVFVSSTLKELADERLAVRRAIERLQLIPVMFELAARPHAPQTLYRAYLDQSHVFVGIYWQSYGWVGPGMTISGLEDEFRLAGDRPRLLYIREPSPDRQPELTRMLGELESSGDAAYKRFTTVEELEALVAQDLAVLLSERFEASATVTGPVVEGGAPSTGRVLHPVTPLLGRSDELADLVELLGRPDVRQVSLTGPPGSGKSRVAFEVGVLLADRFPDGVWEVLLDEVAASDPPADAVVGAVAAGLGLPGPTATLDDVVARLQDQRALLVLDGMEAHAAAGPQLAELLARCPTLQVLVTSRVALRLRGEHEVPVGSLPAPTAEDLAHVREVAACRLLLDRVRAIDPTVELVTDEDAATVAAICRRVDGLPLLLELAAARTRVLPLADLAVALADDPLRALASGAADLPDRHRSLSVLLDDSRRLLSPTARVVLDRLAVFDRGWSLPAATAVVEAAGDLGVGLLDVLDELAAHHLVHRSAAPGVPARWSLLRTTRAHALASLRGGDDHAPTATAHAQWYLAMAEQHVVDLAGPAQADRLAALGAELPNLRAAADWLEAHDEADGTRRLALATARICEVGGRVADGQWWADRGLRCCGGATDLVHASLLRVAGSLARRRGMLDLAIERLVDALVVHEHLDDPVGRAHTQLVLGQVLRDAGDADQATALLDDALEAAEAAGVDWLVARVVTELAGLAEAAGDREGADAHLARAASLAWVDEDPVTGARVAVEAAAIALGRGDPAHAVRHGTEAVTGFDRVGNRYGLHEAMLVVATALLAQDNAVAAARWLGAAEALAPEASGPRVAARLAAVAPAARRSALRHAQGLAFDDAWQAGAATPVADLVAELASGDGATTHWIGELGPAPRRLA